MKKSEFTLEHALYALALVVGLGLRFLHLAALPLSDNEAGWALQALQVTRGLHPAIGANAAYVHLTALLFFIFGGTDFLARVWPALAGSALVLAPWFLRGRLGRIPALLLAFGLAIDPGLAALSRLAGGPMLAVVAVVFAIVMWLDGRRALAGLFGGLALLSGPSAWFGLLGLVLTWAFSAGIWRKAPVSVEPEADGLEPTSKPVGIRTEGLKAALAWGLGTLLLVGSLLLLSPKGLSSLFTAFLEFVRGWWQSSGIPFWQPLLALPAYELLPLGFGIAAAVRGILKKDAFSIQLSLWALVALVLVVICPGRQTGSLAWALLPLWTLAVMELGKHFDFEGRNLWELAATATLVLALVVFGCLNLATLTTLDPTTQPAHLRMLMLLAVVLLIIISLLLVATGWSEPVARLGGVWSGVLVLTAFTVAVSTGATGLRQPLTAELWLPGTRSENAALISKVADEISVLNTGASAQLPLTIAGVDSPALRWLFRNWQVQEVVALSPDSTPKLVITPDSVKLNLTVEYRGEGLDLRDAPDWMKLTSADWLKWFVYRQAPKTNEKIILWVRSDLMLDNQATPATP